MYRTGLGYDLHRLVDGKKYVLGGIEIDCPVGFLGFSDGDVLVHAVIDALLGTCGKRDIGYHFPDTSPEYKDISSLTLLQKTMDILDGCFEICNIDCVIIAETPKLSPYIPKMILSVAEVLKVEPERISIKAKTNEGVDEIGAGKAVSAFCSAMVKMTGDNA